MLCRCREKSFEGAAVALYRQKNFFTRWKHKSLTENTNPPNGQSLARRTGQAYPGRGTSRPNSVQLSDSHRRLPSFRENIALHEESISTYSTPTRGSKRSRDYNIGAASPAGSRYSWGSQRTVSTEGDVIEGRSTRPNSFTDSSAQTSDDLLQSFFYGLRRRAVKSDSNASSRSIRSVQSVIEVDEEDDDSLPLRRSLRDTNRSRRTHTAVINRGHVDDEACETDRLLIEETKLTDKMFLPIDDYQPLINMDKSQPKSLTGQSNRLSGCDTTSEETISECRVGSVHSMDDIEELLSGVGSRDDGSLGSMCLKELEPPTYPKPCESQEFLSPASTATDGNKRPSLQSLRHVDSSISGEWVPGPKTPKTPTPEQAWPSSVVGVSVDDTSKRRPSLGSKSLLATSKSEKPESALFANNKAEKFVYSKPERPESIPLPSMLFRQQPENNVRRRQSSSGSSVASTQQPESSPDELTVISIGAGSCAHLEQLPPQPACVVGATDDGGALQYYKESPKALNSETSKLMSAENIRPQPTGRSKHFAVEAPKPLSKDSTSKSLYMDTFKPLYTDSTHDPLYPAHSTQPSLFSQSTAQASYKGSTSHPTLFSESTTKPPPYDPKKTAKLQEYLRRTRGVDLDLTRVPSSDV